MSLWVKICGLSTPESVEAAVNAGASAIGFVFASSVRQVSPQTAAALSAGIPESIQTVGVFLRPSQDDIEAVLEHFMPDVIQADWSALNAVKFSKSISRLPVCREVPAADAIPKRLLFEGQMSGRGELANWSEAAQLAMQSELVLAGGLDPRNVTDAVRSVKPWGVDVSSGVERQPGCKDAILIRDFVDAARSVF